jgi:NADH dehydrogenase/NADH:ubiquinone oxidoreductase subunit G
MNITIDGKACVCEQGEYLVNIARRNGIFIPTLCAHEGLPEQGCCRVCVVEVADRGRSNVVASCVYPVSHEIEVFTASDKIKRQRGMTLALLHKLAPQSTLIAGMRKAYGAPSLDRLKVVGAAGHGDGSAATRGGGGSTTAREGNPTAFAQAAGLESGTCILCGLCVKACGELGTGAIAAVNRGVNKEIATPYHKPSVACVGCGSCAAVCPTGTIVVTEDATTRTIWGCSFTLTRCEQCGTVLDTAEEVALAAQRVGHDPIPLCPHCRQKTVSQTFAGVYRE